jgi:asparagine synthase (glutamine-hydrolysing)
MCGILYIKSNSIDKKKALESLKEMNHRGPDSINYLHFEDKYFLGHVRLKIIDINDRTNQPFYSRSKKYCIIFNGEIYNYVELAIKYNIELNYNSDTELLVELFDLIGVKMLTELIGMFTFVIVNLKTGEDFIARDRLGVKPLYFYSINGTTIYSSEISSIVNYVVNVTENLFAIRQYKEMRMVFNNKTFYNEIEMFNQGSYCANNKNEIYWSLNTNEKPILSDDELEELLISAINYRKIADVKVGSYLSGGLDSSIIASIGKVDYTFNASDENYSENNFAEIVSDHIKSKHFSITEKSKDFINTARLLIEKRREPLSVPNEVLLYSLSKEAKKYVTVLLSGEGADELFCSYDRIFDKFSIMKQFDIDVFIDYYGYGEKKDKEVYLDAIRPFIKLKKPYLILSAFFQIAHLSGLLRRLDNSSMMASVEARVPFVDHRLVDRLFGVPYEWKTQQGTPKFPLVNLSKKYLPIDIAHRKKIGFPVSIEFLFSCDKNQAYNKWLEFNLNTLSEINNK